MKQVLLLPFPFKTGAGARRLVVEGKLRQKHLSRSALGKRFSESMQQIYRRTPMSKCDFNKVAKATLLKSHFGMSVSCEFAAYFQNTFS